MKDNRISVSVVFAVIMGAFIGTGVTHGIAMFLQEQPIFDSKTLIDACGALVALIGLVLVKRLKRNVSFSKQRSLIVVLAVGIIGFLLLIGSALVRYN